MKNAIVLLALLVVAPLVSQARPLNLVCKSARGEVKASLTIKTEFCRGTKNADGSIQRLFCGAESRFDSINQIYVTSQKNGLSSLSQIEIITTNNVMMPTMENEQSTGDVICRLQELK